MEAPKVKHRSLSVLRKDDALILTENEEYRNPSLSIAKSSDSFQLKVQQYMQLSGASWVYETSVFAVIGIINLLDGPYLIVITQFSQLGVIKRCPIYSVKEEKGAPLNPTEEAELQKYKEMLKNLLESGAFFYSFTYDLTNSTQWLKKNGYKPETKSGVELWERVNKRFVWNDHLQQHLLSIQKDFGNWFPPIIQGFVGIQTNCYVKQTQFTFLLISRRAKKRAGARFITRGADKDGNVANFVETEQILIFSDGAISSFLQIRGSIPLSWKQESDMNYEPSIKIDPQNSPTPFKLHFDEQINIYKDIVVVNLLKDSGREKALSDAFRSHIENSTTKIHYVHFDLHHHCKATKVEISPKFQLTFIKFEKLSILADQTKEYFPKISYFAMNGKGAVTSEQKGIFRTNCKDCLDRTNVTQSYLAKLSLATQLKDMKVIQDEQELDKSTQFCKSLRYIWADNGDAVSVFYAGTPAIRGDVTRDGKQSIRGLINDGTNSLMRYYLNNLQDGNKQNAIDVLLGNYVLDKTSLIRNSNDGIIGWIVSLLLGVFYLYAPMNVKSRYTLVWIVLWMFFFVFLVKIFRISGRKIVNKPYISY